MKIDLKIQLPQKRMKVISSSQFAWMLFGAWLTYSIVMLWHFKEQTNWNGSVCKVAR